MRKFFKASFPSAVAVLAAICLASCAGPQTTPTKAPAPPEPSVKFRLSAAGLAETGMWKCTPVVHDINKDGHLDIMAIARLGDGPHVWLGNGQGAWTDASEGLRIAEGSCGGGIAVGDINRDGKDDLAVADHCGGVFVYLAGPGGRWQPVVQRLHPAKVNALFKDKKDDDTMQFFLGAEDIALGDINGDGLLDIVAVASDMGGFAVYLGDGTGKKWKELGANGLPDMANPEPDDEDNAGWANQVDLRDVNRDGKLDVVASYFKGPRVWLGDGRGHFTAASTGLPTPSIGGLYRGIDMGDVNEDGLLDLVAANDVNGPEVFLQQPGGSWQYTGDIMPSLQNGALGVALGDFNGDRHLDLLVAGRRNKELGNNNGLFLLQGDGRGGWKELENTNLPGNGLSVAWGVAVGDFNEDGLLDAAAATGGIVAGMSTRSPKSPPRRPQGKEGPQKGGELAPGAIPELKLPRMQAWINEGVR